MRVRGKWKAQCAGGGESGTALVTGLITVVMLLGMSAAVMTITLEKSDERTGAVESQLALNVANAGIAHALTRISAGNTADLASEGEPFAFSDGGYWYTVSDQGNETYLVTAMGQVRSDRQVVQAVIQADEGGVFDNAIFAGNSDGDPLYTLELGGSGSQRDEIQGDIYVGGNVAVELDAEVDGKVSAAGTIVGLVGVEGATQIGPDLFAMNYPTTADVKVSDEFSGGSATYRSSNAGGTAWELPEENPAHIFRKNPSDRKTEYQGTDKDDYFLEDPYEKLNGGMTHSDMNAYRISVSGEHGKPGVSGNEKVYYVDGNLWVHNKNTYSMQLQHNPHGTRLLFVVSGNIYFSDNLFYSNKVHDGVAFVAMKDDAVEDSGNIYFGDPVFGTLNRMHAYMYAENNFYDLNLDSSGSEEVEVWGNMSAGNQVVVERDYKTTYGVKHTKLTVDFDERVSDGSVTIPGLPNGSQADTSSYSVVAWRRVGETQLAHGVHRSYEDYKAEEPDESDPADGLDDVVGLGETTETVDDFVSGVGEAVDDQVDVVTTTGGGSDEQGATETRGNDWGSWSSWKDSKGKKWGGWW